MQIYRPNSFPIAMPTHDLLVNLLSITRAALFPKAPMSDADQRAFFSGFVTSFNFVSTLHRTTELSRVDTWIARAGDWAFERHAEHVDIGLSPFLCAVAASGDTDFRLDLSRWPHDIFVGLSWTNGPAATAEGWLGVLKTKKIRASIPAPKSPYQDAPQPRIVQMNMVHGTGARPFE